MQGYGSVFVAACMVLIAGSIGAILHVVVELPVLEASLIALALLFALMVFEVSAARRRDRAEFTGRFEGLARASADIAREVGHLRHRVVALSSAVAAAEDPRPASETFPHEIGELAQVVEDLAQTVAVHEALLAVRQEAAATVERTAVQENARDANRAVPSEVMQEQRTETAPVSAGSGGGPFAGMSEEERAGLVREAVAAGQIELFLQPVVTLPQRKVRYYEALSRMRLVDGSLIDAAAFLPPARAAGLLPKIDERLVQNCVQVVRRLAARNREIGLFLNISPETLADRSVFPELLGTLEANRALAPSLVLEMSHAVYRSLGAVEHNSLSQLADRGFRFSLDRIEDFRIDPRGLADRGVRFVKVSADRMLRNMRDKAGHIDPADLADLLARHGIDLVADHIENESVVVDLLDYDVPYGQGFLFSPPRPVRADVLRSERADEAESPAPLAEPARLAGSGGIRRIARSV